MFRTLLISVCLICCATSAKTPGGGELTPLEPTAETGSYAGQALDAQGNTAAVGHKIDGSYAIRFYEHSTKGWNQTVPSQDSNGRTVQVANPRGNPVLSRGSTVDVEKNDRESLSLVEG